MTDDPTFNMDLTMTPGMGMPQQQMNTDFMNFQNANQQYSPELMNLLFRNNLMNGNPTQKSTQYCTRGSWSQQEDEQLIAAVTQLGPKKWTDIAKFVPTRSSKQCRERWFHCLDPKIRHDPFEAWEDQKILEMQREIGNKWAVIAQKLPGRSPSSVKNRWYSSLKSSTNHVATFNNSLMLDTMGKDSDVLDD